MAGICELDLLNVIYFWGVMKDLREKFDKEFGTFTLATGMDKVDDESIWKFIVKALEAKENEVIERIEKMMPDDKEVNFEENNEAGIKRKVLFEILSFLKKGKE